MTTTKRSAISITGVKGSGKSTAARYLVQKYGYVESSFAAPLKRAAQLAFPLVPEENFWGPSELRELPVEAYPMAGTDPSDGSSMTRQPDGSWVSTLGKPYPKYLSARIILETLGTEWGRRLYQNVWSEGALQGHRIVLPDARFHNELEGLRARGGASIRLRRGLKDALDQITYGDDVHHSRLLALYGEDSDFDFVVPDGLSKSGTQDALDNIMAEIG